MVDGRWGSRCLRWLGNNERCRVLQKGAELVGARGGGESEDDDADLLWSSWAVMDSGEDEDGDEDGGDGDEGVGGQGDEEWRKHIFVGVNGMKERPEHGARPLLDFAQC